MDLYDKRVVGLFGTSRRRDDQTSREFNDALVPIRQLDITPSRSQDKLIRIVQRVGAEETTSLKKNTHFDLIVNYFNLNSLVLPSTIKKYLSILKDLQSFFCLLSPDMLLIILKLSLSLIQMTTALSISKVQLI